MTIPGIGNGCVAGIAVTMALGAVSVTAAAADTRAGHLSPRDRRAIAPAGAHAVSVPGFVGITIDFAGPFSRAVGRGRLARAGAGVVIRTSTGSRLGVVTLGPTGAKEQTATSPRSRAATVLRNGRHVHFIVATPPGADASSVSAAGFLLVPSRHRAHAASVPASQQKEDQRFLDTLSERALHDEGLNDSVFQIRPVRLPTREESCRSALQLLREIEDAARRLHRTPPAVVDRLRQWISARCNPAGSTPGEGGSETGPPAGFNQPPSGSFTFTPNGPPSAPKQNESVQFTGTASDPDGTVVSWKWTWGDGSSTTGTGPTPTGAHAYGAPGIYSVTLTVTDDRGVSTTTDSQPVRVSAAGSKSDDYLSAPCPDGTGDIDFEIEIFIPSYAQSATFSFPDSICPGASQVVTGARRTGNPNGLTDEWGMPKDTYVVTIKLSGTASQSTANIHTTVTWQ